MKSFLFLLLPLFLCAQNVEYPDTIITKSKKPYACFIKAVNQKSIQMIYDDGVSSTTIWRGLSQVVIAGQGEVFNEQEGFKVELDALIDFLDKRGKKWKYLKQKNQNTIKSEYKKWSFGVFYLPYSIRNIYVFRDYRESIYYPYLSIEFEQSRIEGQWGYNFTEYIQATLDITYNTTYNQSKSISQISYGNDVNKSGQEREDHLKVVTVVIGLKKYFKPLEIKSVRPFVLLGIGKKFAFVEQKEKDLFNSSSSNTIVQEKYDEFLSDLNSPYLVNAGFGAEYYFNESLSLFASIRVYYNYSSATYNYTVKGLGDYPHSEIRENEQTKSSLESRTGIGLNFYF